MRLRFGPFTLDSDTRQLRREGEDLHLSRKAFDLLVLLLEHRPGVVDKLALRDRLWPGTTVVDANLNNLASEIRTVLADDPQQPAFLRTVHRVGYAFCGTATDEAAAPAPAERAPRFWLIGKDRNIVIADAPMVIGRDPDCAIWIDDPSLSRRHASVRVIPDAANPAAVIEDLKSTNGTFVEGRRVTAPVTLVDGDVIRIGDARLTFRSSSSVSAPTRRIDRAKRGAPRG